MRWRAVGGLGEGRRVTVWGRGGGRLGGWFGVCRFFFFFVGGGLVGVALRLVLAGFGAFEGCGLDGFGACLVRVRMGLS